MKDLKSTLIFKIIALALWLILRGLDKDFAIREAATRYGVSESYVRGLL